MRLWSDEIQKKLNRLIGGTQPLASAQMRGDRNHPELMGTVSFYPVTSGTLVAFAFSGLPHKDGACGSGVFGLHIHSGERCVGNDADPFASTGAHYNPHDCEHPYHAGDLPPVFENHGFAWGAFYTERFLIPEILDKTVILHSMPDDFTSQPAGNSGAKIACGVIRRANGRI